MSDYTEVSSQGWFSRIASSIKGIFTGIFLFLVAFPLLFWGECRSVDEYKRLQAGRGAVVEAPSDKIDKSLDGKLVHVTGTVKVDETLTDPEFGVTVEGLKLVRTVEMYQWKENKKTEKKKKAGGSEETITTYTYEKTWSSSAISSSSFKEKKGKDGEVRENPGDLPYKNETIAAENATMGPYKLTASIISSVGVTEKLDVDKSALDKLSDGVKKRAQIHSGGIYIGQDPSKPEVGDVRISFQVGKPGDITVISGQTGDTFKPYTSKEIKKGLQLTSNGKKSADEMFSDAEAANAMLTWILRFVGWMLMFIGLSMVFRPLSVIADVIPFIGNVVGTATGGLAFLLATFFAFVTIAVAWVVARPLLGIALLLVAGLMLGGVIFLAITMKNKAKAT